MIGSNDRDERGSLARAGALAEGTRWISRQSGERERRSPQEARGS
jgi:hypothetical protein